MSNCIEQKKIKLKMQNKFHFNEYYYKYILYWLTKNIFENAVSYDNKLFLLLKKPSARLLTTSHKCDKKST